MEVTTVNGSEQMVQNQTQEVSVDDALDRNAFFKLLITQLQNQDPLKPMEDKEFIAQMAQFSSLEQMQNMNENMEKFLAVRTLSQGASLIGKSVEVLDNSNGNEEIIDAKVEKIMFEDGNTYVLLADGSKISTDDITAIY